MRFLYFAVLCLFVLLPMPATAADELILSPYTVNDLTDLEMSVGILPFTVQKNRDTTQYAGMEFPIYIGYLTFSKNKGVVFTKTTDKPIAHIEKFFNDITCTGTLRPGKHTVVYRDGFDEIEIDNRYFFSVLLKLMRQEKFITLNFHPEGEAANHTYTFKKTCVFSDALSYNCPEKELTDADNFLEHKIAYSK